MVLLQVRLLFQFFIFFFPNKKRLPLWQPLSLNGKWLSSTIAPDCGTVKSMNIRLFKIDDQRNKSCEGCNYYSCIRVFWRICCGKCMISTISWRCPWNSRPVLRTPSHYIYLSYNHSKNNSWNMSLHNKRHKYTGCGEYK